MKYEAFLSYARVPDLALATALERSLQAFAKPWNRVRAIDVFRDQSNLSSIGGLASGVTRGIDGSNSCARRTAFANQPFAPELRM